MNPSFFRQKEFDKYELQYECVWSKTRVFFRPKEFDKYELQYECVWSKARLHMRFLMRFRLQNAPYPTLHECFFREVSRGLERKLSHII